MKKLLITGGSGFLGSNLCRVALANYAVVGLYNKNYSEIPGVHMVRCDLRDFSAFCDLFKYEKPDAIIHTAAISNPNYCQENQKESFELNVTVTANIARVCADHSIPFVFTSTDLVFDGTKAPYNEQDTVNPVNFYGQGKAESEKIVLDSSDQAVVCRMPLMFGNAPEHANSFVQPWVRQLRDGKKLSLFQDEFRTPVSAIDASKGLLLALEKGRGILHLGGKERVSRYELGLMIVNLMKLDRNLITACYQRDVSMAAPRPADVSLDSTKAFNLGYSPKCILMQLQEIIMR